MIKTNKILFWTLLVFGVTLIIFFIFFKKRTTESFNGACDGCGFPRGKREILRLRRTCNLTISGCGDYNTINNRARRWNHGKANQIIYYATNYINRLKSYDFSKFDNQENYANNLNDYINELQTDFKRYIDACSRYPWARHGNWNDKKKRKSDYCLRAVSNCQSILNDLKRANKFIDEYYQTEVDNVRGSWKREINQLHNRLWGYRWRPGSHSDSPSHTKGVNNNFQQSNSYFWRAIWHTWYCLEYLRVLIAWYPKAPLMGKVRDYLRGYANVFSGSWFPVYNINSDDLLTKNHIYNYQKNRLAGYAGDKYQPTGKVDDSKVTDISTLPFNERYNAYNNFFFETLGNCQREYNNLDNWQGYRDRYWYMGWARDRINWDNYTGDIYAQKNTINYAKQVFWDPNKNTWRPNQTPDTYSHCKPPDEDGKIENDTSNVQNTIYNFKEHSDDLETKRKKTQFARKELFSSLVGSDTHIQVPEPLPRVCPKINNEQQESIVNWTRSSDSKQPQTCKNKDSFESELNSFRVNGIMKPGCLLNGEDTWINNYETITEKVKTLETVAETTSDYKWGRDGKNIIWYKSPRHTILIREAGAMKERILKDRDWQLSTHTWNHINKEREHNNHSYFVNNYLKMYSKLSIPESPIYDFELHFQEDSNKEKISTSVIFITNKSINVSNVKVKSVENNLGAVKVYHNMYQYSHYLTHGFNPKIKYPSIQNREISLLSLTYNNLNWEKDELINFGHDLYIICNNTNTPHLYSQNNGFLYYNSNSQFGKCFYSQRSSQSSVNDFIWTIFKDPETGHDLLYHKQTKTFLALGINYQVGNNFDIETAFPSANQNLDDNKETRNPVLYFMKQSILKTLKHSDNNKDRVNYNATYADCCWNVTKIEGNKYSIIQALTGYVLWFSSSQFRQTNSVNLSSFEGNSSKIANPLINYTGYIGFSVNNNVEEENGFPFCDTISGEECYNRNFYIIPREPLDISSDFIVSNELSQQNLFEVCPNPRGNNTLDKNKWFFQISEDNQIPYADQQDSDNKYKNIYKMYGTEGDYDKGVLNLEGGGGDTCSTSNYCRVEKKLLSTDSSDTKVNKIKLKKLKTNKQTDSKEISVSVKDIYGRESITHNYPTPLNKYNYQCVREQFNIYKMIGNTTTKAFNNKRNPNMDTSKDDPYQVDDADREVAVMIYSTNSTHIEGRDFGNFPDGTSIWFVNFLENNRTNKTHLNVGDLRIVKKNLNDLQSSYLNLSNMHLHEKDKRIRQKILTWDDILKFQNIGYNQFSKFKVYGYSNLVSEFDLDI